MFDFPVAVVMDTLLSLDDTSDTHDSLSYA